MIMNPYKTKQYNRGFTLIELLVVIAIIGVLSSVVLASLNSARAKARDANRSASIRQVQIALELYYDSNGSYVSSPDVVLDAALTAPLTPTYISKIPTSPSGSPYRYYTASQNPATFYAIYIPYETKTVCYVCGGSICQAGRGWWGSNICQ
jgi:type II secretion system protein G